MLPISATEFIIMGGVDVDQNGKVQFTNQTFVFDTTTSAWTDYSNTVGPPPNLQRQSCAVSPDGKLFIFGGSSDNPPVSTNGLYSLDLSKEPRTWTLLSQNASAGTNIPSIRVGSGTAVVGKYLVVYGGLSVRSTNNSFAEDSHIYFFDTTANTWASPNTVANDASFTKNPVVGYPTIQSRFKTSGSNSSAATKEGGGANIGAIAGGVVGGLAVLLAIVGGVVYYRRKHGSTDNRRSTTDGRLEVPIFVMDESNSGGAKFP
ncbi:hypothetical protein HDV00_005854 [Rhizophlyctis rosea]|nr:hypothetical protein HDV00_005854 [Rhizophlyctis rosea]